MILTLMTLAKIQENGVAGTSAPHRSEEERKQRRSRELLNNGLLRHFYSADLCRRSVDEIQVRFKKYVKLS